MKDEPKNFWKHTLGDLQKEELISLVEELEAYAVWVVENIGHLVDCQDESCEGCKTARKAKHVLEETTWSLK